MKSALVLTKVFTLCGMRTAYFWSWMVLKVLQVLTITLKQVFNCSTLENVQLQVQHLQVFNAFFVHLPVCYSPVKHFPHSKRPIEGRVHQERCCTLTSAQKIS